MKFYILLLLLILISGCVDKMPRVCVNDKCYNVEIFDDIDERQRGLMFRESLASNSGAFFIFEDEDKHAFWMKNVKFPIDIIWLDENYKVVDLKENAETCVDICNIYFPKEKAKYVLEVNVDSGIKTGDKLNVKGI